MFGLPRDNFRPAVAVSSLPVFIEAIGGLAFDCFGPGDTTDGSRSSMVLDVLKLRLFRQKGMRSRKLTVDLMDMLSATTDFDLPVRCILKKVIYPKLLCFVGDTRNRYYDSSAMCRTGCQHRRESKIGLQCCERVKRKRAYSFLEVNVHGKSWLYRHFGWQATCI